MENTAKKKIIHEMQQMSGKYPLDTIFSDWVTCSAIAIQNSLYMVQNSLWQSREEQYTNTMKKYSLEERKVLVKMFLLLPEAFEEGLSDVLGEIYMEAGCGNKRTGQFFTPFHLSRMTAEMVLSRQHIDENGKYNIDEPSVGGGGMIIAIAAALKDRGINYQKCMRVTAQDLDWRSVYMSYVQFSLLGIDAIVVQGDTLQKPFSEKTTDERHILRTPKRMGVLL